MFGIYVSYTGHNFLPADHVFARIDQDIRKKDTILLPEEYYTILRKKRNLYVYGVVNWHASDFKTKTQSHVKSQQSFKISDALVISLEGNKVNFKTTDSGIYCKHTLLKRGKNWGKFKANPINMVSNVSTSKKKDVETLLMEIGASDYNFTEMLFQNVL